MRLLQNPIIIKTAVVFAATIFFLLMGAILIRLMRRSLREPEQQEKPRISADTAAFSIAAYDGVIRKLKEQEKELAELRRTERERATASASLSEVVLANLGSGVVLFNTVGLVRQANPAAKSLMGYASPFGLHTRDIFRGVSAVRIPEPSAEAGLASDPQSNAPLLKAVEAACRQGLAIRRIEADYRSPAGQQRVLGITLSPVRGNNEEPLGAAALISDLSDITRMAQQMRLRESMAALGEMSAGIAHEFKNSLATISGYAQMLQKEPAGEASAEFARKIGSETSSLTRIVTDFLNFARPQGLNREPLILLAMLQDCADEAHVELNSENVPVDAVVIGDPTALRQVFSNLMRNSAEAAGGKRALVKARCAREAKSLRLTLADNGGGIPPEQLERVFIPFFTTKSGGTGLGLALVHRILVEHGGSISAANADGGAVFTLTFPLEQAAGLPLKAE
jgi:signal transduction histidine kinase